LGYGPAKNRYHAGHHHWVRRVKCSDGKLHVVPVKLALPLLTDFCRYCRMTRELLEVSV
jgi:hypothetical protein